MKTRNLDARLRREGFTLLELVVVLAILGVVTTLAVRSLDAVQDQRRYEASRQIMEDIRAAVAGSENDRNADGSHTLAGFISDMGRLPKAIGTTELTLAELWLPNAQRYDVRQAVVENLASGTDGSHVDRDVFVPGGWRGPYLRLPIDASNLLDGWGNPMSSPPTLGYTRLRTGLNGADNVTTAGTLITGVTHFGANGTYNPDDKGVDRDLPVSFSFEDVEIKATIQLLDAHGNSQEINSSDQIILRVYSPDPADATKIKVFTANFPPDPAPPTLTFPLTTAEIHMGAVGLTSGVRVLRAEHVGNRKSAVKYVTLRPGRNHVPLTIYRP